jgi:nitroimidazol reductase NimA-like FMN-containing flavoprotein (pyridoxamine 5'-phosphate oxidase superfamily)
MTPAHADDETAIDEIPLDECMRLLSGTNVGRLAVARDEGGPLVVPVNYTIDGDAIVFRSDAGAKLGLLRGRPVSFEVDYIDLVARTGWSVLVSGRAHEATTWEVGHLVLETWGPGPKTHWLRLVPESITGRRITRSFPAAYDGAKYP